ncbi:potassium-transporting ATPase subunit F [Mycobacterium sp. C31M]
MLIRRVIHRHIPRADSRGVRVARPGAEAGRATVNVANGVGLVLAILIALFLFSALLFPERY